MMPVFETFANTVCRPQDKQAVEAYKADIKAQLTRAGLIRGQPRSSLLQAQSGGAAASHTQGRPPAYHRFSDPAQISGATATALGLEQDLSFAGYRFQDQHQNLLPGVAGQCMF